MPVKRRQSDEGHSHQYFQGKSQILHFFCDISMLFTSKERIFLVEFKFKQKEYGSLLKNLRKIEFFHFWVKNEADQMSSMADFSNFFTTNLKNGFARSC